MLTVLAFYLGGVAVTPWFAWLTNESWASKRDAVLATVLWPIGMTVGTIVKLRRG